jgi:DNA-binding transcriptional MerR regulator
MAVEIPDKLYFRIGEVGRLTGTPQYVLRFWETQFPKLKPRKSATGQRMFRRKDVEMVLEIKNLLYQQGFTIEGARKKLAGESRQGGLPFHEGDSRRIKEIARELRDVLAILKRDKRR